MLLPALLGAALAAPPAVVEPARTGASAPNDAALLIAIERYAFLPPVPHARRDLAAVADALVFSRGVPADNVVRLDGGNAEQIRAGLLRAKERLGADGTLWVYFAGHGAASPSSGELLLVGDDAKPDPDVFTARSVPLSSLLSDVTPGAIVLLDTCWGGAARSGEALLPGARFAVPAYASPPPAVTVWTATSPSQTAAAYDSARHGAFSYFVVGALRGWADGAVSGKRDGKVDLDEAEAFVQRGLRAAGFDAQTPQLTGPRPTALTSGKLEATPEMDRFVRTEVGIISAIGTSTGGVLGGVLGGVDGGLGIAASPASPKFALVEQGFRAPVSWGAGASFVDANQRIVSSGATWEALTRDVPGQEALKQYQRGYASSNAGAGLIGVGVITSSLSLVPFAEYNRKMNLIDDGGCATCTPERNLRAGAITASVGAAAIATGIALFQSGKPKRQRAKAELVDYINGRMLAEQ